jgi:hypothetical protein
MNQNLATLAAALDLVEDLNEDADLTSLAEYKEHGRHNRRLARRMAACGEASAALRSLMRKLL